MTRARTRSTPGRIGNFQVLHEIGQGGMGVVYLADQPSLDRHVVLKKIRRELLGDATAVERFGQEARAAASVHHQNVVAVYDSFTFRGDHYIAQEWVPGLDLQALIGSQGKLDPPTARWVALEIARGLEEIHGRGIVHRDLKPANILIGARGEIKIADFGIAFGPTLRGLTTPGMMMGSLPYMSPEQLRGERIDARTDLYNFALIVWEMLAGATPFGSATDDHEAWQLVERMRDGLPRARDARSDCPRDLDRLLRDCLSFCREDRPADATALRRVLERRVTGDVPARARAELSTRLAAEGVEIGEALEQFDDALDAVEAPTAVRPLPGAPRRSRVTRTRVLGIALVGVLAAFAIDAFGWWRNERPSSAESSQAARELQVSRRPPPAAIPAVEPALPARLEVIADPWAFVTIDGEATTEAPGSGPIELTAGTHLVALRHPVRGAVLHRVELRPGELQTLHHAFDAAEQPGLHAWREALGCGELERALAAAATLDGAEAAWARAEIHAVRGESAAACQAVAEWRALDGAPAPSIDRSPRVVELLSACQAGALSEASEDQP